jgi:hypothetical protein
MVYENRKDWPEKYDINKLVSIQASIDKIISGEKVSERRNDRYADAGDELLLDGHRFIVEDVYPQQLKELTDKNAKEEGYKNLEDYKEALTSIHHGAVWNPEQVVWAHYLKEK